MTLFLQFLVSAAIIVLAGIKLTAYADLFSDRLKLGKVWVGVFLLGFVTSLPEAVASLTAVVSLGANNLAIGNMVGSNNFNILLFVLLDLFAREGAVTNLIKYNRNHMLPVLFSVFLTLVVIAEILFSAKAAMPVFWGVSLGSLIILVGYFQGIKKIKETKGAMVKGEGRIEREEKKDISFLRISFMLFVSAFFVVLGAMWLAGICEQIARVTGLGQTFVGSVFLAIATSLPEMVVTISALKLGSLDMALGNIFGSNMTNVLIVFLCDLFYRKGAILATVSKSHVITALLSVLLTGVIILGMKDNKKKRNVFGLGWDTSLLSVLFVFGMGILFLFR